MSDYCKLSADVVYSSMWEQDGDTCKLWITMLALKDKNGVISQNITGIKRLTGISIEKCQQAIDFFCAPDPLSSSKELDGRRLEAIEGGGWRVVNHEKYQELGWSEEKKKWEREKKAKYREGLKLREQPVEQPKKPDKPRFQKPTKEQIVSAGLLTESQAMDFIDHFDSNGWKVGGKTPMVDWMAAARKWGRTDAKFNGGHTQNSSSHQPTLPVNPKNPYRGLQHQGEGESRPDYLKRIAVEAGE